MHFASIHVNAEMAAETPAKPLGSNNGSGMNTRRPGNGPNALYVRVSTAEQTVANQMETGI